jgi:hypothetical protein
VDRTSNARKQNSAAISNPSLLTACQMALAVTSGLSITCAVSGLVTHYINAHDYRNLRKEAPMLRVGATGTKQQQKQIVWKKITQLSLVLSKVKFFVGQYGLKFE